MTTLNLKYGRSHIPIEFDDTRFEVLGVTDMKPPLTDAEIGEKLDNPIGSKPLEEIVGPGETVLIVVPDATREAASGQIVNLLVRRLIANGSAPHEINAIFATGIHRRVTEGEKEDILTPFIAQRIKTLHHDARNPLKLFRTGETSGGIPVELNWVLTEYDHIVLVGGVSFHYFAGFTGGRKLICPGLASARTISETHRLAFDCERKDRRAGVGPGSLDGNAVHEAFMEAVATVKVSFAINTVVNDAGEAVGLYCGDWISSHRDACEAYAAANTITISEKRDLVIASCGGHPFDINMIQAHKALDAASRACSDGGTIILLAECPEGLGREDFLEWFEAGSSSELADRLCENYQVSGQTAWSLMTKSEKFDVRILSSLPEPVAAKLGFRYQDPKDGFSPNGKATGYILPYGAKYLIHG